VPLLAFVFTLALAPIARASQPDADTRARVRAEVPDPGEQMPWPLIVLALSSRARLAVVPAQDLLGLGSEARMNTPGTAAGNWGWQAAAGVFDADLAARGHAQVAAADRLT